MVVVKLLAAQTPALGWIEDAENDDRDSPGDS